MSSGEVRGRAIGSTRELCKTGLAIPPLVFGATSLGNLFKAVSDKEKACIVEAWALSGLKPIVIDTAGKYGAGLALEVIGRELARLDVSPDAVVISNKLGWRRVPLLGDEPTFEPGAWVGLEHDAVQDISYDGILRCWEEGNRLLGVYSAGLVSVHDPDEYLDAAQTAHERSERVQQVIDAYRALCELRDAGEVIGVGIGAKNWRTIAEFDRHCDFDWVMLANSLTLMQHPPELLDFVSSLAERKIGVVNSALFHGGFLLGGEFIDYRRLDPQDETDAQRLQWRARFKATCQRLQVTPFEVGVAFGQSHPGVTAVALSSSRADRIPSHLQAVGTQLPSQVWDALRAAELISPDYPYV